MTTGSFSAAQLTALTTALADRYRIERELGAGGMATVWLAEDVRHRRRVAVKVLHPELSAVIGPERFLKEIELTANLQHPHILPLFDSGSAEGLLYYVMPFVEGETLRAWLERERQLPVGEAVRLATEVADALQYAHARGVVHRDVKPENVLLQGGRALVADFGIALAVQQAGGERMTHTGLSLGTPQYMAPEQAMGERTVDARADVYALGAMLYEMLVGQPPFTGPTMQAVIARMLTERPIPPSTLRDTIPPHVEAAVLTALEKLPADRFAGAAAFAAALAPGAPSVPSRRRAGAVRPARQAPVLVLAAIALGMAALAAWAWLRPAPSMGAVAGGPVFETAIVLPDSTPVAFIGSGPLGVGLPALAISPDGGTLVFAGEGGGTTHLFVRRLDNAAVTALSGTEGAYAPFFSPDGQSVGFFARGTLKRASLGGGPTVALADLVLPYGAVWLADDRILVVTEEGGQLVAVPAAGGAPMLVGPAVLPRRMVFPERLPGDSAVLMSTIDGRLAVVSTTTARIELLGPNGPVPLSKGGTATELFAGTNPRFVANGHLLYHSLDGAVMALPFDPETHRPLGAPAPVLSGVRLESIWGAGQLVVTRDGALIYARGENGRLNRLVWRDERGRVDTLGAFGRADYGDMDLSADGTRLVVRICTSQGMCAPHVLRLREGVQVGLPARDPTRTFSGAVGWSSRGERVFDRRPVEATTAVSTSTLLYPPESPAEAETLPGVRVHDVARDGSVLYQRANSLYVARTMEEVAAAAPNEGGFRLPQSDAWGHQLRQGGEWVAYSAGSEQTGDFVVFLARTRPPFERWRASPRGGEEPVWTPAGDLVYREGNRWMSIAAPRAGAAGPGAARFLFTGPYLNVLGRSHDVGPDGRYLLIAGPTELTSTSLTVVTNWAGRLPAPRGR